MIVQFYLVIIHTLRFIHLIKEYIKSQQDYKVLLTMQYSTIYHDVIKNAMEMGF